MAALLILGGFLLIGLGLLWLVVLAFKVSLLWGFGSLFPPITLLFIVRCWSVARKAVVFTALGFVPLTAGVTQLASEDASKFEALLSLSWLQNASDQVQNKMRFDLYGELYGQSFQPHYGELIDGVLVLREGRDFFAQRELRIALPRRLVSSEVKTLRLDVLPQDSGDLPEIEIMWLQAGQALPEARRISRGYTLHLDLLRQPPNTLQGDFHLVLPPQFKTSMSGNVQLLTDHLKYIDGQVDRKYDAISTLEYVIEDYLQRRFSVQSARVAPIETPMPLISPIDLTVTADISGQQRTAFVRLIKDTKGSWMVAGDQYPKYLGQSQSNTDAASADSTVLISDKDIPRNDRRIGFTLQRLLANPAQYQNVQMQVQTRQGNQVLGRFVGLNAEGAVIIEREVKAPGMVSFTLLASDISQISVLEP
ncbi:MFS transporter [Pseudomonas sp. C27(2019)]|uniref:MFS transporter n=1 Tax=Pseudomonas sp. C27(2019) TaxID=2604941 RepID=UPI001244A78D|nr:MFS transporter [Pseudomonas sp. C27(2019)]QEY58422.1 MFS transporter [Pseudomonas sp. C27(2019)]